MNKRRQKKLSKRLVLASSLGELAEVRTLLRAGAQPAQADNEGTTPLYAASVHGAADLVSVLLDAGAHPDTESGHGTEGTPLCAAACWGHTDAVRVLLERGADPVLREDYGTGNSPLDWARAGPHPDVVRLLREAGGTGGKRDSGNPCRSQVGRLTRGRLTSPSAATSPPHDEGRPVRQLRTCRTGRPFSGV
ncbi:ankyrin repeat domain-containing protein [Streptomyces sp. ISL-14]|nr:ankyrin repeat domain-containing protein [Streptomyces sp. ISL-14]